MAATNVLVPKKMGDGFDRDRLLAQLFSLPIPPTHSARRHYPIHTPLGRIMRLKGLSGMQVSQMPGSPYARTLTEYLAGRKQLTPEHRRALARNLGVDPRLL